MTRQYKIIDLFSGCGGSALGFEQAGFEIKVAVDINKTASETFKKNFPESTVFNSDITKLSGKELFKVSGAKTSDDIIILACPPCQGFSTARRNSQRKGDPRNFLIDQFVRIVGEIKPYAFVMENVPGLASGIGKPLFLESVRKLKELGYDEIVYKVVNTADYGIPQRRKRLIMMGTRDKKVKLTLPTPSNRDPIKTDINLPIWNTVRDAISDLPRLKAGEHSDKDPLHVAASVSELNMLRLTKTPHDGGSRIDWPVELYLECHKKNNGHNDVYGRMKWDYPSPTMTGGCSMITKGRYGHPEQDRAISLREAARLQTFSDDFIFTGSFQEVAKQIGNAVPSLLSKKIGLAFLESIKNS